MAASDFIVSPLKKIWRLSLSATAMLAIQLIAILLIAPAFADASPEYGNVATSARVGDHPIELAQANPQAIGGIDDYMHQQGDGPSTAPSSSRYSPQLFPPPGYAPRSQPPAEWNNRFQSDPNAQRNLLIGAAVVGAIAVGMWAYQQHQIHQAQAHAHKRYYRRRYGYIE